MIAPVPALAPDVCQVWWVGLDDVRPEHDALLSEADLERRARLRMPADRLRMTAAWTVARCVLAAATGTKPESVRIDRHCPGCGAQHGKPRLPDTPDLQLSVSHAGGCAVVAVAWGPSVGVDVEDVVPLAPAELAVIAAGTLAPEERAELIRQPPGSRHRSFTTWWTRKEAVLKASGAGLSAPLEDLVVSAPGSPPRVLRWDGGPVTLHDLHAPPGSAAALAVLDRRPLTVEERDAGLLLRQTSRRLSGLTRRSQRYP